MSMTAVREDVATAGPPRAVPQRRRRRRTYLWSYVYLAPMMVLLLVFVVYPIIASLGYTFYKWDGIGDPSDFVGLGNFRQILHDSIFWRSLGHTFAFYRTLFFLPVVTSAAVIGVVIQLLVSNFGDSINNILLKLHVIDQHIDWLGDPHFALAIIILVGIWHTFGYNLVYFLAGLQTIPDELYEAARLDGAGRIATFRYITVPMLRAVGVVIVVLAVIGTFQIFDLVQVLTSGGPYFSTEVVNTYIYHLAFGGSNANAVQPDIGLASAASFIYGVLLIVFSVVQVVVLRSLARRRATGGRR